MFAAPMCFPLVDVDPRGNIGLLSIGRDVNMLVRLLNGRGTIVPVALVTFLASTLGLPAVSVAQTSGAKASVLMVPIQRGPGVPESVPVRAQEMLSALLGIEPGVKLTLADVGPEEVPEQLLAVADETPVVEVASPQVGHPDLDKADKLAATGIDQRVGIIIHETGWRRG